MNKYLLGVLAAAVTGFIANLAINYGFDSRIISFTTVIVGMVVGITIFRNAR